MTCENTHKSDHVDDETTAAFATDDAAKPPGTGHTRKPRHGIRIRTATQRLGRGGRQARP
jgi:hypothetical protein